MDILPNQQFKDDIKSFFKYNPAFESQTEFNLFLEIFAKQLNDSAEFGLSSSDEVFPDITIEGCGEEFHSSICIFLQKSNIAIKNINWYKEVNKLFPNVKTLLKANFSKNKIVSVSIYYQSPIEPNTLNLILKKRDALMPDVNSLWDCMKILERKILFIGIDLPKEELPAIQPYLLVPPEKGLSQKLEQCAKKITGTAYPLEKWHNLLTLNNDIFVSFSIKNKLTNRIKIDYEKVPVTSAYDIAKDINIDRNIFANLVEIAENFDIKTLSFLGIKLTEDIKLKYYIKRSYFALNDEKELLARFLERTAGRFAPGIK